MISIFSLICYAMLIAALVLLIRWEYMKTRNQQTHTESREN